MQQYSNITDLRNHFYDTMPVGDVTAWDMITWASNMFKEFDQYIDTPPPSSHQGEVVKDSGIWNEAIEAGRKYQSQVGQLGGHKETCIAVYADGYIDGQLSQPAPPTPVEGPWMIETMVILGPEDVDKRYYLTNRKLRLRIDGGIDDESWDHVARTLNQYNIHLWSDDQSPLIISHLEEHVKELQGRKGLRWVNATEELPDKDGEYCIAWSGGYWDAEYSVGLKSFYVSSRGTYPALKVVRWLSDSPAPEQVDVIDAYKEYIQLLTDELSELAGMAAVHGWKSTRHEKGVELRNKIESLQNKQG